MSKVKLKDILNISKVNDTSLSFIKDLDSKHFIYEDIKVPVWEIKYNCLLIHSNETITETIYILSKNEYELDSVELEIYEHIRDMYVDVNVQLDCVADLTIIEANYLGELILEVEY